ncbi:hypothetical protein ACQKII_14270 [Lysinibacillus sp. NPDC048646]|uniref:hypothetical protein n=1 Tax=Lysinibacillus sp. NPDC048646 TaxID=3390574 RepID=UPI003D04DEFF
MTKFIQFVSKILTKQEINNTSAKVLPLKANMLEAVATNDYEKIDAVDFKVGGYMLRQSRPEHHRYQEIVGSTAILESKIS